MSNDINAFQALFRQPFSYIKNSQNKTREHRNQKPFYPITADKFQALPSGLVKCGVRKGTKVESPRLLHDLQNGLFPELVLAALLITSDAKMSS